MALLPILGEEELVSIMVVSYYYLQIPRGLRK
jgi:hypothetical protein